MSHSPALGGALRRPSLVVAAAGAAVALGDLSGTSGPKASTRTARHRPAGRLERPSFMEAGH